MMKMQSGNYRAHWSVLFQGLLVLIVIGDASAGPAAPATGFFVTSIGNGAQGGDYGGLQGADQRCDNLAFVAGLPARSWAAYLSTAFTTPINARDRIGPGPWFNHAGTLIASGVADLHLNGIAIPDALDEFGNLVPLEEHDILTGSGGDGTVEIPDEFAGFLTATCGDYTSNSDNDFGALGHVDGGGVGDSVSESWNSAHLSSCSEAGLSATLGTGRLYCFATNVVTNPDRILVSDFEL